MTSYFDPVVEVPTSNFKPLLKLTTILLCYGSVFFSLVQLGFWLYEPRIDGDSIGVLVLLRLVDREGVFTIVKALTWNFCLLLIFGIPHTFMTERKLIMTKYWKVVHYNWEIDKAIYNLVTSIALQILMFFWLPIGASLWRIEFLSEVPYSLHFYLHVLAWSVFYGTNLMIDLPDLIGLNQVMIACPTSVVKSPEFRTMIETQRHMGLLPLIIVLFVHPCMSLDRFLLAIGTVTYAFCAWRSESCYPYAKNMRHMKHKQYSTVEHNSKDG